MLFFLLSLLRVILAAQTDDGNLEDISLVVSNHLKTATEEFSELREAADASLTRLKLLQAEIGTPPALPSKFQGSSLWGVTT